jgi:hypothetical protein
MNALPKTIVVGLITPIASMVVGFTPGEAHTHTHMHRVPEVRAYVAPIPNPQPPPALVKPRYFGGPKSPMYPG